MNQQVLRTSALRFKHLEGFKIHTTPTATPAGCHLRIQSDDLGTLHVAKKRYKVMDKRNIMSLTPNYGSCDNAPGPSLSKIPTCIDNLPASADLSMLDNSDSAMRPQVSVKVLHCLCGLTRY